MKVNGANNPIILDGGFALRNLQADTDAARPMDSPSARDEQGFTLVELLIAMALMAVGVAATLGVFGASGRTTVVSQQTRSAPSRRRPSSTGSASCIRRARR